MLLGRETTVPFCQGIGAMLGEALILGGE